jgi:hypothetical protein
MFCPPGSPIRMPGSLPKLPAVRSRERPRTDAGAAAIAQVTAQRKTGDHHLRPIAIRDLVLTNPHEVILR